jgi:nitrite reductase/ring-hydroxylating ferredoxin subunit
MRFERPNLMNAVAKVKSDLAPDPVIIPVEAYISPEYARQEQEKLWRKVWQVACREEEIPNVGDFVTYDILDQSVIVTRSAPDTISAYYNVCQHRGRRLTEGCGNTSRFRCKFHGWQWNLQGENVHVQDRRDWPEGTFNEENLRLPAIKTGTWAGYVFINFDPESESLEQYLEVVPFWLDPFEIAKMRYRWRQWLIFPCNWKVALEAFIESYHVPGTHPQLLKYGQNGSWSRAHGKHSCMGIGSLGEDMAGGGTTAISTKGDADPRKLIADFMEHLYETVNANTTKTIIDAAKKLVDVLPRDATPEQVAGKMFELAATADAERGVIWPNIEPEHFANSGIDWHVFPNTIILHGVTFILGYRARPNGTDPDSCVFEVYVLERFPEGEAPKTENLFQPDMSEENWRLVLAQDFANMGEVQRGVKSWGFKGMRPSPLQEQSVINFHRNLAGYMGTGAPEKLG